MNTQLLTVTFPNIIQINTLISVMHFLIYTSLVYCATYPCSILAVSPGQPSLISDDTDVVALVGTKKDLAKQINLKEVHWGVWSASVLLTAIACSIYLLMIWIQQIETIHTNQLFDGILSFSLNF